MGMIPYHDVNTDGIRRVWVCLPYPSGNGLHDRLAGTERSASRKRFLLAKNGASAAANKVASKICYLAAFLAKDASIFTRSRKLLATLLAERC